LIIALRIYTLKAINFMEDNLIFNFNNDITNVEIPENLNNPFGSYTPEIARIAAVEFQIFISKESKEWDYDFNTRDGKMFGVLVIQKEDNSYGYLGSVSGKISRHSICPKFAPSVFDDSTDDYFINTEMSKLSNICNEINACTDPIEKVKLKEHRRQFSYGIQQRIFENSRFTNIAGIYRNVIEIFEESTHGQPPAAAGECAAPKLIQHAINNNLKTIAIAEFWWGNPLKTNDRIHKAYYPACKNKCRPILEFLLNDRKLYKQAHP